MTTAPIPEVTDHAVLRWLERVHGIDVDYFRRALAAEVAPFVAARARSVIINGYSYEFDKNVLVTVRPKKRAAR